MLCVYDNACNLLRVVANSDPVLLAHVHFVLDRFHACNHVGCNLGFHDVTLDELLADGVFRTLGLKTRHRSLKTGVVSYLNTSTVEQVNSLIHELLPLTGTMSFVNAWIRLRHLLAMHNTRQRLGLHQRKRLTGGAGAGAGEVAGGTDDVDCEAGRADAGVGGR